MVLPFEARASTSESRRGGGSDQPDFALYDGPGGYPVVLGEGKLPEADLKALAFSTERNNQIGRYLAQTRAVLLCNVRAFGLLTVKPGFVGNEPVPPQHRSLELVVDLWPSIEALRNGTPIVRERGEELGQLVECAATRYASIAEPESLARILARFARDAKNDLPAQFSDAVRDLLDDFGKALGISFQGPEGEEFLRSSLVQTAFYGLFAGWCIWRQGGKQQPFRWEDLPQYLRIPFLGSLFHEFQHPKRIHELRLAVHLARATEALERVDQDAFFARFQLPSLRQPAGNRASAHTSTAITYFYEPFLEAFDPNLRKELGVWYTPPEIVRYQVRRVDQLLRQELGCLRGFADDSVVVLDPCCGTGAYLVEVLRCIADQFAADGDEATLGTKLQQALSRRVLGFEILTAPFVVAQLQAYLLLAELGVQPHENHRPAIFLTNALTGWEGPDQVKLHFPELQEEHDAARGVKRSARIIVVLGNPPVQSVCQRPDPRRRATCRSL
ncbi:MAG: N-6 DNA methylase [Planctomycetes bacterium]|nr:N-6 DNA methylase [Planctomycetota bacterium]